MTRRIVLLAGLFAILSLIASPYLNLARNDPVRFLVPSQCTTTCPDSFPDYAIPSSFLDDPNDPVPSPYATEHFYIHYASEGMSVTESVKEWSKVESAEVQEFGAMLEEIWDKYVAHGFDDPPFSGGPVDFSNLIDIYVFYLNYMYYQRCDCFPTPNAFASDDRMLFDSYWLGNPHYVDIDLDGDGISDGFGQVTDAAIHAVPAHELFHVFQRNYKAINPYGYPLDYGGNVVLEGQARAIQDMIYDFTDEADATDKGSIVGEVREYLGDPCHNLIHLSYEAALFWKYAMEQYGQIMDEPYRGIDFLVNYWQANDEIANSQPENFIPVFDHTLDLLGYEDVTFKDVFCDFIVASYAQNLTGTTVQEKYRYFDQTQPPGPYGPVHIPVDVTPAEGVTFSMGERVGSWCPNYTRYNCDNQLTDYYTVEVHERTNYGVFIDLLVVDSDENILLETCTEGAEGVPSSLSRSFLADAQNITVIVGGLDYIPDGAPAEYELIIRPFNEAFVEILDPQESNPTYVGDNNLPGVMEVTVDVYDDSGNPIRGLMRQDFQVQIGSKTANVISSLYLEGQKQYLLEIDTPPQASADAYDLTVGVLGATDTESGCVIYDTIVFDSVIVVDHSGSMSVFDKMDAAKESARLYVDSFAAPEMLALVEFNESAQLLQGLADATGNREVLLSKIDEIIVGGLTSVGGGMLVAQDELYLNGGAGHRNHIVLLTDGRENTPPTISQVRSLLLGNNTLLDVVLIGEDAQVGLLEEIARETGGNLYHVPEPSSGTLTTDLASIYLSIAERIHRQQRVYSSQEKLSGSWLVQESFHLDSVSEATFVFSYRADQSLGSTSPQLELPDTTLVSPTYSRESESDTSGDFYGHFLWEIPASQTGTHDFSLTGSGDIEYLCEAAVRNQVSIRLAADTGPAIRYIGEQVPILVTLQDGSPINAANVWAHITSGANYSEQMVCDLPLYDDGAHADALANDGIYGNIFTRTTGRALEYLVLDGITFRVSIKANGTSSGGESFTREAFGAFHLIRPMDWDQDSDNLPDVWEDRYVLDSNSSLGDDGYDGDPDGDYLLNADELQQGTNPMECDTDWGGESDYSEVQFGRSPLYPVDDYFFDVSVGTGAFPHSQLRPGDANVTIFYSISTVVASPSISIFRASGTEGDYSLLVSGITGNKGQYLDAGVANGQDYYYRVAVTTSGGERSRYSTPTGTTPKVDLVPPHGAISIDGGNRTSGDQHVILNVFTGEDATQIRISNNPRFEGAAWQPVDTINDIPWTLDGDGVQFVYAQFRDAYGNIGGSHNGTRAFDAIRVGQIPAAPPRPDSLLVAAVVGAATVVVVVLVLVIKKRR